MNRRTLVIIGVIMVTFAPFWASAYVRSSPNGVPVAWALNCLRIYLNANGSEDLNFAELESAVVESMAPWNDLTCSGVELIYEGAIEAQSVGYSDEGDNHNVIVFRDEMGEWIYPADVLGLTTLTFCSAVGGACGFAGQLLDADIEFNGSEAPFSAEVGAVVEHHDFANTLTHELGHFIGLDHSLEPESTMFASAPIEEIQKRTLAQDDIDGFCAIYDACEARNLCGLCDNSGSDNENEVVRAEALNEGCGCDTLRGRGGRLPFGILLILGVACIYAPSRSSFK